MYHQSTLPFPEQSKTCKQCGEVKPLSAYWLARGKPRARCISCLRQEMRDRYWGDPEKARASAREWASRNRDANRERWARYSVENREHLREVWARYRNEHREELRQRDRIRKAAWTDEERKERYRRWSRRRAEKGAFQAYRAANRERVRENQRRHRSSEQKRTQRRERQSVRNHIYAAAPIAKQEVIEKYGNTCYLCRDMLTIETMTMDHVIPLIVGGQHVMENLRPACGRCNSSKGGQVWRQIQKRNPLMAERIRAAIRESGMIE